MVHLLGANVGAAAVTSADSNAIKTSIWEAATRYAVKLSAKKKTSGVNAYLRICSEGAATFANYVFQLAGLCCSPRFIFD